jgi:hypothetical protein
MLKQFTRRCLAAFRSGVAVLFATPVATTDTTVGYSDSRPPAEASPATVAGRLLILPGVGNTRFHLAGFVESVQHQLPRFDIEVRTWGVPFLTSYLGGRWQTAKLLPVLDPNLTAKHIRARWAQTCKEP